MEPQIILTCPTCHQPIQSEFYFCPNCGTKLKQASLSVTIFSQIVLYSFSIILPLICFIFANRWKGITYLKSKDPKEKQIGIIACTLLALSTIITIYLAYVLTERMIQSSINSINTDFNF